MKIIAHRGNSGEFIENSISACQSAVELFCDAIEVDLQEVDGHYFLFHDRFLQRLTDHSGDIYDYQFCQLTKIYLKSAQLRSKVAQSDSNKTSPKTQVANEKIATLEDLIKIAAKTDVMLNIELKGRMNISRLLTNLKQLCDKHGFSIENILISAFNHSHLLSIRKLDKKIKIGLLRHHQAPDLETMIATKPYSQHVELEAVTQDLVENIQAQKQLCFVYTVNYEDQFNYLKSIGVDGIFTDYPAQFLNLNNSQTIRAN
jgi:glycerophosphoryl diester phosphodiesterase